MSLSNEKSIAFLYNGHTMKGRAGDSVGSALFAAGVRIFSRSFQFHRPRGLFCVNGRCVNCCVRINGHPHIRSCSVPLEPGMVVQTEGGWPSVSFDLWRFVDYFDFLFPPGFQYRYFSRPRWLCHLWERILRNVAAQAAVPSPTDHKGTASYTHDVTDVAVVGGGPAGLNAAIAAARCGLRVTLIDDDAVLGGSLKLSKNDTPKDQEAAKTLARLVKEASSCKNISIHLRTQCFAYYGDGPIAAVCGNKLIEVSAKAVVIATGAYERPMIFGNNDLPGVMLSSGVLRLLRLHAVPPGKRAVVVTRNDAGMDAALALLDAGVKLEAVVDERSNDMTDLHRHLHTQGITILTGYKIKHAHGWGNVRGVTVVPIATEAKSARCKFPCDVLIVCGGFTSSNELCFQATGQGKFLLEGAGGWLNGIDDRQQLRAYDGTPMFVAGNAASIGALPKTESEGRIAGLAAAANISVSKTEVLRNLETERTILASLQRTPD